jgi:peptide-methionine (R)-S-oxide reductase
MDLNWKKVQKLAKNENPAPPKRMEKSEEEWKNELSAEQFQTMRKSGTDRPGEGEYCGVYEPGLYSCAGCGTELFDSTEKFKSGTGWPSFTQPVAENVIRYEKDSSFMMTRIEVLCNVCGAHLGHVFPDGPEPTGLRYCLNSTSLKLVEAAE